MTEQPSESATESADPGSGLVRLRWLKILRYRNVRPGTELRFDDTRNILLGKNGSGKTTLLKLLAAVISSEFRLLDDPYELEYEIEINGLVLSARAWAEEPSRLELPGLSGGRPIAATLQSSELSRRLRLSFRADPTSPRSKIEIDPRGGGFEIEGKALQTLDYLWGWEAPALQRASTLTSINEFPPEARVFSRTMGVVPWGLGDCVRRFDESLDTFRELTGAVHTEDVLLRPRLLALRDPGEDQGRISTMPGTSADLWRRFESTPRALQPEDLRVDVPPQSPLRHMARSFGVAGAEMKLCFEEKRVRDHQELWEYRRLRFQFTRPSGAIFSHEALSYGQKRLLAFLYYLSVNDHIVIADELVNGLHHEWITLCLDEMGSRQAFLTSQNPLLLDYLPPESVAQARQRYILCRGEGEELIWENMPEAEAERFFRAYAVGIQHVSEVLQEKGLW